MKTLLRKLYCNIWGHQDLETKNFGWLCFYCKEGGANTDYSPSKRKWARPDDHPHGGEFDFYCYLCREENGPE